MVRNDTSKLKMDRLQTISGWIAKSLNITKNCNVALLKIKAQYEIGLSYVKAEEYIQLCVDAHEEWAEDHGSIVLRKVERP